MKHPSCGGAHAQFSLADLSYLGCARKGEGGGRMAACFFCRGSANGGERVDKAAILEKLRG
jgi:hypothetical protein